MIWLANLKGRFIGLRSHKNHLSLRNALGHDPNASIPAVVCCAISEHFNDSGMALVWQSYHNIECRSNTLHKVLGGVTRNMQVRAKKIKVAYKKCTKLETFMKSLPMSVECEQLPYYRL